jgi:predicted DsbA family dithiol-disulfide isomerase
MPISVVEFTDPGCPFAYSAEPHRRRLLWLYADHEIEWRRRMVVLARSAEEYTDKGLTTDKLAAGFEKIAAEHGMPIDTSERPRMWATLPACTAVVAARLHAPQHEEALLRRLRVRCMGGELLDERSTIDGAARDVGLDPDELATWMDDPAVTQAVESDADAARDPMPAARALDGKLADWPGGRRYTCPSYELTRPGDPTGTREVTIVAPGFQPVTTYEVVMANLFPALDRRDDADSVEEVLEWAGEPLATQEVAAVRGISREEARAELVEVADEHPLGTDAFWTLRT